MTADNQPVGPVPTLLNIPSFSFPAAPDVPAASGTLAPLLEMASTTLNALLPSPSSTTTDENVVVKALAHSASSAILLDKDNDLDLEDFFNPPSNKGKSKASAPGPSATPAPLAPPVLVPTVPVPASPAGPSSTLHPWLKAIGYLPVSKPPKHYGAEEHKANCHDLDTLAAGTARVDDKVSCLMTELAEVLEGVNAHIISIVADISAPSHAAPSRTDNGTINMLVTASNKHTTNLASMAVALCDSLCRIEALEKTAVTTQSNRVTQLEASVDSLSNVVGVLMGRVSAMSGTADMSAAPGVSFVNANSERPCEDNETSALQNVWPHVDAAAIVAVPDSFVFTHPGNTPMPPPPHPVVAIAHNMMLAPKPLPLLLCPPPSGPPRAQIDPACEVHLGPVMWDGNFHHGPCNLVSTILRLSTGAVRFSSCESPDDNTVLCVFESDAVADWFVTMWNNSSCVVYEVCVVRSVAPKA
ncbi:hypothetical protein B0H10DRAFT_1952313 [Mycena sp. CBHHK59/15]|nr:hypothetical protein B0H10DRAFT_1952313 [Mycena sp. CBHHK59/15]